MRFIFLFGAIAGAVAGYFALWSHLQSQIEAGVQQFLAAQNAQGRIAEVGAMHRGGFPYRLSLRLERLAIADPGASSQWQLGADEIVLHFQLWNFRHGIAEIPGMVGLVWIDGQRARHAVSLQARESARASLVLDGSDRWERLAVDLRQVAFGQDWQGFTAGQVLLHVRQAGSVPPGQDISLQVQRLQLPPKYDGPLGREIADLRLLGRSSGPWLGTGIETALRNWRDAGGIVDFQTVALHWGGLRVTGDGSLALDRDFRPLGAMGGQIYGAATAIDALAAAGRVKSAEAALAKTALKQFEKRDSANEPFLPLPLTLQDGRLSIGSIPLLELGPLIPSPPA